MEERLSALRILNFENEMLYLIDLARFSLGAKGRDPRGSSIN